MSPEKRVSFLILVIPALVYYCAFLLTGELAGKFYPMMGGYRNLFVVIMIAMAVATVAAGLTRRVLKKKAVV